MIEPTQLPTVTSQPQTRQEGRQQRREQAYREVQVQEAVWSVQVRAMGIRDETRLTALQADAAMALGGHIMEGVVQLDQVRRRLAQEDITLNLLLADIETETVNQVKNIQRSLFNPFAF